MSWGGRRVAELRCLVIATYGLDCWICQQPIDLRHRHPNPASFSIDHVVRRVAGGPDAIQNLRPAHLGCNCGRGTARPDRPARTTRTGPGFF